MDVRGMDRFDWYDVADRLATCGYVKIPVYSGREQWLEWSG